MNEIIKLGKIALQCIVGICFVFYIFGLLCAEDNISKVQETSTSQISLSQYPKQFTFNGYVYEIYQNPEYGYYVFYADITQLKKPFDLTTIDDIIRPYGKYENIHIYILDKFVDFSYLTKIQDLNPEILTQNIQKNKPILFRIQNSKLRYGHYTCIFNNGKYELYTRGLNRINWTYNSQDVDKVCKTNF